MSKNTQIQPVESTKESESTEEAEESFRPWKHEFKHDSLVRSVAFSNDGSMLATGDEKQRYMMSKQKQRYMNLNTIP